MTKITIILLGESGVGKTTLLQRLKTGKFHGEDSIRATCNVEFEVKKISLEGKEINLFIWDTAGQERYRTVVRSYYRQGDGVLLVYDVTDPESFYKLSGWLSELRQNNKDAEVLIAGNKNEDSSKKAVAISMVKSFAKEEKLEYMEMSAKSGKNVEEAFLRLAKKVLIAKGILTNETSNSGPAVKCDNSAGNGNILNDSMLRKSYFSKLGIYGKITPKNIVKAKEHDVIRLDATPMVQARKKKRSRC